MAKAGDERDTSKLRKVATDFWFAVQRMGRRREEPPPAFPEPRPDKGGSDDDFSASAIPRRPAPTSGSASAAVPEPDENASH